MNLASIQNFGSMDILCSNKTGTLTSGKTVLHEYLDPLGDASQRVLLYAYINSFCETGIKSAPESVLDICTEYEVDGQVKPLDAQARTQCKATYQQLSAQGCRVLALASRCLAQQESNSQNLFRVHADSAVSALAIPFVDTGLVVAHTVVADRDGVVPLLDRFLAAVVVDILVDSLHRHPVAAVCIASEEFVVSSASLPPARCMCL
jgi:hypothetical protein